MSVLSWLLVAPAGLLFILGLAWFEDHVLRPPTSPGEQVLQRQNEAGAPGRMSRGPVNQVAQGTAELLSLVRLQPRRGVEPPAVQERDSAA